jgi:Domain of unknown function (DUF4411)
VKIYWIDSSVFIEAQDNLYPFKNVPGFWKHIDVKLQEGSVRSSEMVYKELVSFGDDLSKWIKSRKANGVSIQITPEVEDNFTKIANWVKEKYDDANANDFLKGADGWIIAHAMVAKGIVVSQESQKHPNAKKARIPDVCHQFGVKCVKLIDMLKDQDARL